jgi:hypothetical protein
MSEEPSKKTVMGIINMVGNITSVCSEKIGAST